MPNFPKPLPLSLYIHIPWCVRKCPYCDFNSHAQSGELPEQIYVAALLSELDQYHHHDVAERPILSIFFGGGTPSLFSPAAIEQIIQGIKERFTLNANIEITLEANPGTVDSSRFVGFKQAGINRLSLGIQSLQNNKLQSLGRIHDSHGAINAIENAKQAGFENFNIDLMYGLPKQSIEDALTDLNTATAYAPSHISWYQLTIEPNTRFAHHPPAQLPNDDLAWEMQIAGQAALAKSGFAQYEVSAYARTQNYCQHNLNYWQFGDYLGLGAGAHSKLTNHKTGEVVRASQVRNPRDYLQSEKRANITKKHISDTDLIFEFMLNALRLCDGFPLTLFSERTGLPTTCIRPILEKAAAGNFLTIDVNTIQLTSYGKRFLNEVIMLFLP